MPETNDNTGIESGANNAGNFEGSVSADAPSSGATIESNMSAENGGGYTGGGPQVGNLDLDSAKIGPEVRVMDSRIDDPSPAFMANVTGNEAKAVGMTVAFGALTAASILTKSPGAGPSLAATIMSAASAWEGFMHAAADAQQTMGKPGAFTADVVRSTTVGDPLVSVDPVTPVTPYWVAMGWSSFGQFMGFAPDVVSNG